MKKKLWNGITFKMAAMFLLLLVPVYALLVSNGKSYIDSLQNQTVTYASGIMDLGGNSLEAEIRRLNIFLYNLQNENMNYSRIQYQTQGSDSDYTIATNAIVRSMQEQVSANTYESFLFLNDSRNETLIYVSTTEISSYKSDIREALEEEGLASRNNGWDLVWIQERPYLIHSFGYDGVYAGAGISLAEFQEQIITQIGLADSLISLSSLDGEDSSEETEGYVTIEYTIENTDCLVRAALSKQEIYAGLTTFQRLTYMLSLAAALLIPLLMFLSDCMITRPLRRIEHALGHLARGDQDYRIQNFHSSNEFESLALSFNDMADEIHNLKIETYERQLEKEEMQMQNLMLQTRPHFLLNTFNQIFNMAQFQDYEGIQKMTIYLSKYFRYLFTMNEMANIRQELELAKEYVEMMKIRYLDCFTVVYDIDEALLNQKIPKFLLHNFVDNIFKYAVDEGGETEIVISLKREGEFVVLRIQDDGPGIEEDVLERIVKGEPVVRPDGTHVGIWNSVYRLKNYCGEKSEILFDSVLSEGTTATIKIPYRGEDKNGETVDPDCG